jgi:hypothetical protein
MRHALLVLLLALGPAGGGDHPAASPSLAARDSVAADLERLEALALGAWRGEWRRRDTSNQPSVPLEAAFSRGLRPSTLFGYFTFTEHGDATTLRRLGLLAQDHVRFTLSDGRAITLHASGDRLIGDLADGAAPAGVGVIELTRIRR